MLIKLILILLALLSAKVALSDLNLYEEIDNKYKKYIYVATLYSLIYTIMVPANNELYISIIICLLPVLLVQFLIDSIYKLLEDKSDIMIVFAALIMYTLLLYKGYPLTVIYPYLINGLIIFIIYFLFGALLKFDFLGLGDVKLISALSLLLPYNYIFNILLYPYLIAIIYAIPMLILKKKSIKDGISFGPFIILSFLIICI